MIPDLPFSLSTLRRGDAVKGAMERAAFAERVREEPDRQVTK